MDANGESRFESTYRYSPYQMKLASEDKGVFMQPKFSPQVRQDVKTYGVASRFSSQRGCMVKVEAGAGSFYPLGGASFEDPEAWSPIIAEPATGRHARCTPDGLRYRVYFRLSQMEYQHAVELSTSLLDTPVLDDVTITYMRRPKVLQWRDVTE